MLDYLFEEEMDEEEEYEDDEWYDDYIDHQIDLRREDEIFGKR